MPANAAVITTPGGQASVEGNGNNIFPFGITNRPATSQRYQQVYAASQFSTLAAGGEFVTKIAFRPDGNFGAAFSTTLPSIRIDLSTTGAAVDGLSTTFANNVGANNQIVFGGAAGAPLALSSSFTGPAGGPKNFDIVINLTTPFLYNPAAGNLLLDVRNFGAGTTTSFDAQNTVGDSISRVSNTDVNSGMALADSFPSLGLITQFTTSPVPEPGSALLLALGVCASALFRRNRQGAVRG